MKPHAIHHLMKPLYFGLGLFGGLAALDAQEDPNLIAYDGLDYPLAVFPFPFNSLEGNNGGTGWAGAWKFRRDIPNGKGDSAQFASFLMDPLPYQGPLATTGNAVKLNHENNTLNVELARELTTPITGTAGTRTYISFIGQRVGPAADPNGEPFTNAELYPNGYPTPNNLYPRGAALRLFGLNGGEVMQIGHYSEVFSQTVNLDSYNTWEIAAGPIVETDEPFDQLSLAVLRIDHNGDSTVADSIYLWINPDLTKGESTADAQIQLPSWTVTEMVEGVEQQVAQDFSDIKFIGPWTGNASGDRPRAEFLFDELRVGKTWESVTPGGAVVPKYGPWPIVSDVYIDSGDFLGWMNVSAQPYLWNLTLNKYLYIPQNSIAAGGSWVYIPNTATPPGGDNTWAGWPIVSNGYVDTGSFFSWMYVASGDWVWSVTFNKYIYLPQSYVTASGAWAYIPL